LDIILENISKKFNRTWIFREVNYHFEQGKSYAILGSNGSGKSTLLQVISGFISQTKGNLYYQDASGKKILPDQFFSFLSIATPYMVLPEEFTLHEMVVFHSRFKKTRFSAKEIMQMMELEKEKDKEIKDFSSGMKQRLKLGLALFYESSIVLLDEPATNLDAKATQWYRKMTMEHARDKTLIISSNQEIEYDFCEHELLVENFKK
jgi:ABC-type multidrug transport system ATPase subunit